MDGRQGQGARPPVALRRVGLPLSRTARGRASTSGRRSAGTGSCRSPSRTTSITKVQVRYYDECTGTEIAQARPRAAPERPVQRLRPQGGGTLWAVQSAGTPTGRETGRRRWHSRSPPTTRSTARVRVPADRRAGPAREQPGRRPRQLPCAQLQASRSPTASRGCRRSGSGTAATRRPSRASRTSASAAAARDRATRTSVSSPSGTPTAGSTFRSTSTGATVTTATLDVHRAELHGHRERRDALAGRRLRRRRGPTRAPAARSPPRRADQHSRHSRMGRHQHESHVARDRARTRRRNKPVQVRPGDTGRRIGRGRRGLDGHDGDPNATGAVESVHTSLAGSGRGRQRRPIVRQLAPEQLGRLAVRLALPIYPTVGIGRRGQAGRSRRSAPGRPREASSSTAIRMSRRSSRSSGTAAAVVRTEHVHRPELVEHGDTDVPPEDATGSPTRPRCPYTNSSGNPWRCVLNQGGSIVGQAGDWMAVATNNCNAVEPRRNAVPELQDGRPATSTRPAGTTTASLRRAAGRPTRTAGFSAAAIRPIHGSCSLFVVPYQALKNVSGSGSTGGDPDSPLRLVLRHELAGTEREAQTIRARIRTSRHPRQPTVGPSRQGHDSRRLRQTVSYEHRPGRPERHLPRGRPDAVQGHARPMICR